MFCLFLILISIDLVLKANFQELDSQKFKKFEADTNYQYPFVVFIKMPNKNDICTGALLSSNWILTAAHCVYKENNVTVYVKSFTRNNVTSVNSGGYKPNIQERRSLQIVLPWIWTSHRMRQPFGVSDIALIEIEQEFDRQRYLIRVPIPTFPELPIPKNSCKIVGLGKINYDKAEQCEVLAHEIRVEKKCSSNIKLVEQSREKSRNWICQVDDRSFKEKFVEGGSLLMCDGNHMNELNGIAAGTFRIESQGNASENKVVFMNICPYLTMIRSYVGHSIIYSPGWQGNDCFSRSSSDRVEFSSLRKPVFNLFLLLLMFIKLFV